MDGQYTPRKHDGFAADLGRKVLDEGKRKTGFAGNCGAIEATSLLHEDAERRRPAGVGRAVKESGISREKIWITSKLWPTEYGESKTLEAIDKILEHMQLDLFTSQPAILWVHGVIWEKYVHWESVISMQMTRRSRKL